MVPLFFQQAKSAGEREKRALKPCKRRLDASASGHDDQVEAGLEGLLMETVGFADAAADAVAHDGVPQFFADSNANAVLARMIFAAVDHKIKISRIFASGIESAERMILFQTVRKTHKKHLFP